MAALMLLTPKKTSTYKNNNEDQDIDARNVSTTTWTRLMVLATKRMSMTKKISSLMKVSTAKKMPAAVIGDVDDVDGIDDNEEFYQFKND